MREKELGPTDRPLHFYPKRLDRMPDVEIGVAELRALDAALRGGGFSVATGIPSGHRTLWYHVSPTGSYSRPRSKIPMTC